MSIQHVKGTVSGITQGANVVLNDQNEEVIIPEGVMVRRIVLRGENIEGPADLSLGVTSNNDRFIAASEGLTTTMLEHDHLYTPHGFVSATEDAYVLRLYSSDALPNSTIRVALEYTSFDSY